jgi:hypothetical protein
VSERAAVINAVHTVLIARTSMIDISLRKRIYKNQLLRKVIGGGEQNQLISI